ncbi:sialidase family protein [Portibacter lacus]|uniref:Sialidase domain-containing protein n=1 Tax=Portibacter lacus TaxID=1099794 RepID=A0AA37SPA2_9BACT|nr:sialidase family protein [Portibacter lacus]GLR17575.1 hypothetical protein GCM10007940_21900 [Portibacter lacus]
MSVKRYLKLTLWILFCVSCNSSSKLPEVKSISHTFLFNEKVTDNCHAATVVETQPDELMAAWFGGSYEGAKDVGIYSSTYNGSLWTAPINLIEPTISNNDTFPCWNPVLFKSRSNCLYLFYKIGKNPREWYGAMITSKDNGKTWSEPQILPEGILGPIKNKPIEVKPGEILCGSSTESVAKNEWRVHVEIYNEESNTWKKIPIPNEQEFEIIQPTFLEHSDNSIQMLCRSKHDKVISSWSSDFGYTWENTDSINIVNSNSGIDALTMGNNTFLLVNNPLPRGADWFIGRNVLDVEYSKDGLKWDKIVDLENKEKGEFSYPAIIQSADKKIHILYTFDREYIKHVVLELDTHSFSL